MRIKAHVTEVYTERTNKDDAYPSSIRWIGSPGFVSRVKLSGQVVGRSGTAEIVINLSSMPYMEDLRDLVDVSGNTFEIEITRVPSSEEGG